MSADPTPVSAADREREAKAAVPVSFSHKIGCAAVIGVKRGRRLLAVRSGLPCSCGNEAAARLTLDAYRLAVRETYAEEVERCVVDEGPDGALKNFEDDMPDEMWDTLRRAVERNDKGLIIFAFQDTVKQCREEMVAALRRLTGTGGTT